MNKLKQKILAFICSIVLLSIIMPHPVATAFNYPKIKLGQSQKGKLPDYFDDVCYELNLNSQKKVKINYTSTSLSNFCVYDGRLNKIFESSQTKKVVKALTLKKGNYVFGIYNNDYEKGNYSLLLKDATSYVKDLSFEKNFYTISFGKSVKPKLIKIPKKAQTKSLKYSSSNKQVAVVNSNGKINAVGLGKAIITVESGKLKAQCTVLVNYKKEDIFVKGTKSFPKINGVNALFTSENSSVVKVKEKSFAGVSNGTVNLVSYSSGEKYTLEVRSFKIKTFKTKAIKKLKNTVNSPSLVILNTYRGYNTNNKACIVIDYAIKSGENITNRKYFICTYNEANNIKSINSNVFPRLTKQKQF